MPGYTKGAPHGYLENEYSTPWPGLFTSVPSSRIPPGACVSCNAAVIRGRLQNQPSLWRVTGTGGLTVHLPTLAQGENICLMGDLQPPGFQQGFTVVITNVGVYVDYVAPGGTSKTFTNIFNFPNSYGRYAKFGSQVIGNNLYFSSGSQRGVYILRPVFALASVDVTNPGGYFTGTPTVVFSDGGGSGATATATVSGANLTALTLTANGSGYFTPPLVTFNGGSTSGPGAGQSNAAAVGILSTVPSGYAVAEVTAQTGVASINVTAAGTGYVNPQIVFIGGGGSGAAATAIQVGGAIVGITVNVFGNGYTTAPTVQIVDSAGTGATATAFLFNGKPFIGADFMATMSQRLILGNLIGGDGNTTVGVADAIITNQGTGYASGPTVDFVGGGGQGAAATATQSGGLVNSITVTAGGSFYYTTPAINLLSNTGTGATAIVQLGNIIAAQATDTAYHDRIAWSAPNAYGYFDPNYGIAPGGFDTLTEARGVVSGLAVVEGALFVGHSGGQTETTPNSQNSQLPFSFFPLWSADQTVKVRYGSLAQYGSTVCFLGDDSAYMLSPNGLQEIGQNIANLLQGAGIWNNGSFPLQGLYGSIVELEGQKHYLIAFSSDDWDFQQGSAARQTFVYDYNMAEQSWHTWDYPGITATCPIYQSLDIATYAGANSSLELAKDDWILLASTSTVVPMPPTGPIIALNPSGFSGAIPFHYVARNTSVAYVLPITNPSLSALTISAGAVTGPNAADFVLTGSFPITIPPGGTNTSLTLTFTPTQAFETNETATLTLTSTAVSGTHIFAISGVSANPGTSTGPYTPTPAGSTAFISAAPNSGSQSNTGLATIFPSTAVPGGAVVNVSFTVSASFVKQLNTGSGGGDVRFQRSEDGGSTWNDVQVFSATASQTFPGQTIYDAITGLLNLNTLQYRCLAEAACGEFPLQPGDFFSSSGNMGSVSVTIVTVGDVYCSITEKDGSGNSVPPVLEFGLVDTVGIYVSNLITLSNPTANTMVISLTADTANGYSIINQMGSTTLGPNNANQLTFNVQLTGASAGSHDDTNAVTISISSQVGALSIEAWYFTNSGESASIQEMATVNRSAFLIHSGALLFTNIDTQFSYQFATESPAIARILSERRLVFEYENLEEVVIPLFYAGRFTLDLTLSGQQDPTPQANVPINFTPTPATTAVTAYEVQYLSAVQANVLPRQVYAAQVDFSTFAGVCTTLSLACANGNGFVSLVRITQVSDLPKEKIT